MRVYYVYILTNDRHTVLYIGSTSNLKKRVYHHKNKLIPGFTKKYNVHKLVYFEKFDCKEMATSREQQIKNGSRQKKIKLIESQNKEWKDLYDRLK